MKCILQAVKYGQYCKQGYYLPMLFFCPLKPANYFALSEIMAKKPEKFAQFKIHPLTWSRAKEVGKKRIEYIIVYRIVNAETKYTVKIKLCMFLFIRFWNTTKGSYPKTKGKRKQYQKKSLSSVTRILRSLERNI